MTRLKYVKASNWNAFLSSMIMLIVYVMPDIEVHEIQLKMKYKSEKTKSWKGKKKVVVRCFNCKSMWG